MAVGPEVCWRSCVWDAAFCLRPGGRKAGRNWSGWRSVRTRCGHRWPDGTGACWRYAGWRLTIRRPIVRDGNTASGSAGRGLSAATVRNGRPVCGRSSFRRCGKRGSGRRKKGWSGPVQAAGNGCSGLLADCYWWVWRLNGENGELNKYKIHFVAKLTVSVSLRNGNKSVILQRFKRGVCAKNGDKLLRI